MTKQAIYIILLSYFSFFTISCNNEDKSSTRSENSTEHSTEHGHEHQTKKAEKTYYTCSMHPNVEEDKPGKCPICHMNLTKVVVSVEDQAEEVEDKKSAMGDMSEMTKEKWGCENYPEVVSDTEELCPIDGTPMIKIASESPALSNASKIMAKVKLRKAQLSHFNPEIFPATHMKMTKEIRLLGTVLQSEEKESKIPARISGRVEHVYIKSTGAFIKKGDPIIKLYSPQLITAGEEYINAKNSYLKNKNQQLLELLNQSEERLLLWGIKKSQLDRWLRNKKVPSSIKIYSNVSGIVQKRNAIKGKYFKEGQNFFELTDLTYVWVEMDVYEHDSSLVGLGQNVVMAFSALPRKKFNGEMDFISPVLNPTTRTLKIRTTIKNSDGKLKPGMVADAVLTVEFEGKPLVVPRSAIIDTGKRKVVWKQINNKKFQAILVETGLESEGFTEILSGIKENDKIVIEGNFLLDAQAQLFGGYEDIKL